MKLRAFPIVLALAACATPQHVTVSVSHDVTVPTSATISGPAGIRGVSVHCTAKDTVFEKDGYTITFVGKRGYRGEIGERSGRLIVGDVVLRYDGPDLWFEGPLASGRYESAGAAWSAEIDQSGAWRMR